MKTNKIPVEQVEKDIAQATGTLKEAKAGAAKLRSELATLAQELAASEVCQPIQLRLRGNRPQLLIGI